MSRIVGTAMLSIAEVICARLRKGTPLWVLAGAICGGTAGAMAPLAGLNWRGIAAIIGAITGATLAAIVFQRPARLLHLTDSLGRTETCGVVRHWWQCMVANSPVITVLMEHAVYSASPESLEPSEVVAKLAEGEDPEVPAAALVRLRDIAAIEFSRPQDLEVIIRYRVGGRRERRRLVFTTVADRQAFLDMTQEQLGEQFTRELVHVSSPTVLLTPALCILAVIVLGCGAAWLASYWRAFPPPPPLGKAEQDKLVQLLMWAGPQSVLLVAAVPFLLLLSWLALRLLHPARVYRLTRLIDGVARRDPFGQDETEAFQDVRAAEVVLERSRRRNRRAIQFLRGFQVLLIIAFVGWCIWAIPLYLEEMKKCDRDRQEAIERTTEDIGEAVRNGEAGEAFKRLFPEDHAASLDNSKPGEQGEKTDSVEPSIFHPSNTRDATSPP